MKRSHISFISLLFVVFLCFYLFYQILSPFLESIFWALLLAMVFYPLFRKLRSILKGKEFLSALTMTVLVTLVIVIPFTLLIISLANEVIGAYGSVEHMIQTGRLEAFIERAREIPMIEEIWTRIDKSFGLSQAQPLDFILKNLQQISTFLFNQSSRIFRGLSTFFFSFFFTLLSLYYLFKDGDHLFAALKEVVPIPPVERDLMVLRFQAMVNATIYGGLLIAIIQGLLGGLAFWILGIHSPVLWGTAMAFFSFIPLGGTALIWVPASIILFIEGFILKGIILLGIGVVVISTVDNLVRPSFISSKTNIHPLLLFFAVLGGIQVFGLIGLVAGPLVVTLCLTLIEIYAKGVRPKEAAADR